MASLACGRRLSLRNQYDTKTPRASVLCCARQTDGAFLRANRRPSREKPGHARVTKKFAAWVSKCPSKTFFEKRFEKFPQGSRITAGLVLHPHSKVIFKRSTWARGPQAVLKDSCLVNTLGKLGLGQLSRAGPPGGRGAPGGHSVVPQGDQRVDGGSFVRRETGGGHGHEE